VSPKQQASNKPLDVPEAVAQKILWYPGASYNVTTADSWQTIRSRLPFRPKQCNAINLLDVSGWWVTGSDGKVTLHLSDFICLSETLVEPVNVVAAPTSGERPAFLTVQHALVNDSNDIEMTFWTWNPDGTAAPETSFDWRCRVPYWQLIL
jgi:hypothetical protein